MYRIVLRLAGFFLLGVFFIRPVPLHASDIQQTDAAPDMQAAIDYLLGFAEAERQPQVDMQRVAPLLAFVDRDGKNLGKSYSVGKRHGAVSDYYEFSVHRSLKDLLALVYNPDLPSALMCPASMRRARWIEIDGRRQALPRLSEMLPRLNDPLVIHGREFIENSPDTNSGSYYAYDLLRTLILARYDDRPVLISISIQPERSGVGRKGLVVGPDQDWDYVYTGEKGSMLAGLGWADSYMYYSASIMVYRQMPSTPARVRCAGFKWIKAGWAGMNLVKPYHIRKGVQRFATAFKEILESPDLPAVSELTRVFKQINGLSLEQLRAENRRYLECLSSRKNHTRSSYLKWLQRLNRDEAYLQSLGRDELLTVLYLEYLKSVLGKPHCLDIEAFVKEQGANPS